MSSPSSNRVNRRALNWDVTDEEVPRIGLPDAELLARRQRWYRRLVWSSVVLAPLALLTVIVVAGSSHAKPVAPARPALSVTSPGRTVATQALDAWLAQTPSPLPGAVVLSWDGARTIAPAPQPKVKGGAFGGPGGSGTISLWSTEVDTFTLVVPAPKPTTGAQAKPATATVYKASVAVALDPHGGGGVSMGGPSLIREPHLPTSEWYTGGPWSGIKSTSTVSGSVQQAINGWLSAYTSGSPSALSLATGDTDSSHVYVPLSGVRSATDTVIASAPRSAPNGPVIGTGQSSRSAAPATAEIVQVALDIVWNGQAIPTTRPQGQTAAPKTTMDLLVERADTAAPVVVAWGAPGTGPELRPYQNALPPTQVTAG